MSLRPPSLAALRAGCVLALALCVGACTHKIDITGPGRGGGGGGGGPTVVGLVTPAAVQSVFDAHCVFCHSGGSPSGGQNLGSAKYSWANLVGVPANEDSTYVRVLPGNSADSYLVMKLKGDPRIHGSAMPLGGAPLDAPTLAVITGWIDAGAPAETLWSASTAGPVAEVQR